MGFEFPFNFPRQRSSHELLRNQYRELAIDQLLSKVQMFTLDELVKDVVVTFYKEGEVVGTITTKGQLLLNAAKQAKARAAAIPEFNQDFDSFEIQPTVAH